jgi:hypothetical protein
MAENLLLINLLSGYDSNRVRRRNFKELGKRIDLFIKDQKAKILGSICMDMLMVDVRLTALRRVSYYFGEQPTALTSLKN